MLNHETYPGALHVFLLFQVSGEQFYADVAKDILLYVSRDLSDKVKHLWRFCPLCGAAFGVLCTGTSFIHL